MPIPMLEALEMASQLRSIHPRVRYRGTTHSQPDSTGSLLRIDAHVLSEYVSDVPVPNNVCVFKHFVQDEFTFISYDGQQGWVRTMYLKETSDDVTFKLTTYNDVTFKLTTYNILTGGHPWVGLSPYEAETTGAPNALWDKRKCLVVDALRDREIILLNETTNAQLAYITTSLKGLELASRLKKQGEEDI